MNRLGYGTGKVDGVFGKNTKSAIMKMQKFLGLKQDGIVGVNTRDLINDSCKSSS
jgi:peptidoglycan hydrolase-like protein with peptidoglycan-binding domain